MPHTYSHDCQNQVIICAATRSPNEPQFRCLMKTKNGEKYCPLHLAQKNVRDYTFNDDDYSNTDREITNKSTNKIFKVLDLSKIKSSTSTENKTKSDTKMAACCSTNSTNSTKPTTLSNHNIFQAKPKQTNNFIMREQKVSTIEQTHQENENDLEIKLLILVNSEAYEDILPELIGPVFHDVTVSEDEQDPVTYDVIWSWNEGLKVPGTTNKYFLFSYCDSKEKIRCMTIFTIYNMFTEDNFIHPITMEPIPEKDIERAKQLIELYQNKLGLFKDRTIDMSPEFVLKNDVVKLFKQFERHSIYFEEGWLLSIEDKNKLYKIINETRKFVSNNIKLINPSLKNLELFQRKEKSKNKYASAFKKKTNDDPEDTILELKKYLVSEWEKLINAADSPQNQVPIWIIATGLSSVVPQVKQKFPDMQMML